MTLVERDNQLTALGKLMTAAIAGHGRIAAVRGAVGTGKTALLRVSARIAKARGALVLESSASRLEQPLSFGVLGQLFHGATLPAELADGVSKLLAGGAVMSLINALGTPVAKELTAFMLHDLCRALLAVAERQPLVIVVDDAQHADALSVRCLSYVATRIERSPVLLVYSESGIPDSGPAFPADLPDRTSWHRIDLAPLSEHGTRRALAELTAALPAGSDAVAHRLTGGNPALLHALVEDYRLAAVATGTAATTDTAMRRFLTRLSPAERTVATGLAVLGADAPTGLLGRLINTDSDTVAVACRTLTAAGVLVDGWFRDPMLAMTTLAELPLADRASLRVTAAGLLRDVAAAPVAAARQLVAAAELHDGTHGQVPASAVPVLGAAASQAEQAGDLPFAIRCLRAALDAAGGEGERAACLVALARAEWRVDPMLATRHLPELTEAIRAGLLDHRQALLPIHWLVWFGQVEQALELMAHLHRLGVTDPADVRRMRSTRLWLAWLYPSQAARAWQATGGQDEQDSTPLTLDPMLHAAQLFTEALATGAGDRLVAEVEKILHGTDVPERTSQMVIALTALVYGERLDVAAVWCDALMRDAAAKGAPTRQAIFAAMRADIAARQGDMPLAEEQARAALEMLPPASWGVAIGFPLGSLIWACTATGRHGEAAEHLRTPVPDAMFQTVIGVHYLRARSLYFQATGRHSAALLDCHSCGELLVRWGLDAPAFVPWRGDTAVSHLWLGRREEARKLAEQQLALTRPAHQRTRGVSLRVLAATRPLEDRVTLLAEAVAALRACGDRLELTHALVDLADTHRRLGRYTPETTREALELSAACGVPTPGPTGSDRPARYDMPVPRPAERLPEPLDQLSDAELRVAELAAAGHTNRQIADQLFVTVSTVEQHLTKTYRKLRLSRRTQLRAALSHASSARTRDAVRVNERRG